VLAARIVAGRHVIVLGPSTSISDCLLLIQQMRERQALCSVILIQHGLHPGAVHLLVEQGVHGVLDESASEQDLALAIQTASLGKRFLSGPVQDSLMQPIDHLTEREIQVLSRLKYGESNLRIASVLGLKEKTIEKYLTTIYQKLHVHSRMETILYLQKMHF
jgi:DNA-binding NarL/FixJ family response regulator